MKSSKFNIKMEAFEIPTIDNSWDYYILIKSEQPYSEVASKRENSAEINKHKCDQKLINV